MRTPVRHLFLAWLPFAALATFMALLVYAAVQQDYRQSANDPQVQMAEDLADQLLNGNTIALPNKVDISKSLAPFVMLFDDKSQVTQSTATIKDKTPFVPSGVFATARKNEHLFTWQPQSGARSAVVLVHYDGKKPGFVLVGRSLREVEKREAQLRQQVLAALAASLVATVLILYMRSPLKLNNSAK